MRSEKPDLTDQITPDHHRSPRGHDGSNHKEDEILYSSENRSDQRSEEFSSDEGSDAYSSVVRGSDLYSVVSPYSYIVRGQGPLYIVESE